MSEEIALNLPLSVIEELQCFICRSYLSSSPVLLLPPGNYICGHCAPLNTETPVHRLVPIESLLGKLSFPCIFKKHGCAELLLFGRTAEHESKCEHKPFGCPTNVLEACPWEGNVTQFFQHFEDAHPSFIKEKSEFQLELNKDVQGVLVAVKSSLLFIGKYYYKAKDRSLHYDVRSCSDTDGNEISWKMQLINGNDLDCNINLKTNECLSYDETFCGVQNGNILDVTKFVEILGNPDLIKVAVNFMIVKLNCNGATLDLKAIENLKCVVCCNYLVPPLFYLDSKAICDFCSRTNPLCMPCDDPNLLKLVSNAIYPCRWRGCNFVCKSNIFNDHLINCEFRLSCCIYSKCKTSFRFVAAGEHLKTHEDKSIVYMPNEITYKTSFAEDYTRKDILTSRNKKLIMFRHKMVSHNSKHIHEIKLYRSSDHHNLITGVVHFEHMHCTLTKKFEISGAASFQVALDKLPPCFKQTDELTVSVDLFV